MGFSLNKPWTTIKTCNSQRHVYTRLCQIDEHYLHYIILKTEKGEVTSHHMIALLVCKLMEVYSIKGEIRQWREWQCGGFAPAARQHVCPTLQLKFCLESLSERTYLESSTWIINVTFPTEQKSVFVPNYRLQLCRNSRNTATPMQRWEKKIATFVKVSQNTISISNAAVFVERSKPQTDLKSIIGTGCGDR